CCRKFITVAPERHVTARNGVPTGTEMFGKFTTVEVVDPHQTSRLIWESLTPEEKALTNEPQVCAREFAALDWRRFQSEPESFRSQILFATANGMRATRVINSRATQYITRPPGMETYCIALMERGTGQMIRPGSNEPAVATPEIGLIIGGEPGTRFAASDDSSRSNLWVSGKRLRERLEFL